MPDCPEYVEGVTSVKFKNVVEPPPPLLSSTNSNKFSLVFSFNILPAFPEKLSVSANPSNVEEPPPPPPPDSALHFKPVVVELSADKTKLFGPTCNREIVSFAVPTNISPLASIVFFITAPADVTFAVSVISANASIPFNLVLSLSVIIEPEPAEVISLNVVALLVVYTPFVTLPAFPLISPIIVFENVFEPLIV